MWVRNIKYIHSIVIHVEQGWATYGPRATCGPPVIFLQPTRCLKKKKKNLSILHHHKKRASCLEFIGTNDVPQCAYHHHSLVISYSQTFCKLVWPLMTEPFYLL